MTDKPARLTYQQILEQKTAAQHARPPRAKLSLPIVLVSAGALVAIIGATFTIMGIMSH